MAKSATKKTSPPWQWNKDVNDGRAIVSKDDGKTWDFATDEDIAVRDAETANAPPVPAGATAPAGVDDTAATPVVSSDGKTAKIGDETLDVAGQVVNMDGHHKAAQISLHSPTDAKGQPVVGEGDYERMYKDEQNRANALETENKRLRVINGQLMSADENANKHLRELQGQEFDSLGLPKVKGV